MKTIHIAFLAILSSFLCSCLSIYPQPPKPAPRPTPEQRVGPWLIRELDHDGSKVHEWEATKYKHTLFPRTVEFKDATGKTIRLTGSFEIARKP